VPLLSQMMILSGLAPKAIISRATERLADPGPDQGYLHESDLLAHDLEGVDQPGQGDGRGSLLVIVPDRDAALPPEAIKDGETLGLGRYLPG